MCITGGTACSHYQGWNHRMPEVGWEHWRSSSPSHPCVSRVCPQHTLLRTLSWWPLSISREDSSLSRKPVPVLSHSHSTCSFSCAPLGQQFLRAGLGTEDWKKGAYYFSLLCHLLLQGSLLYSVLGPHFYSTATQSTYHSECKTIPTSLTMLLSTAYVETSKPQVSWRLRRITAVLSVSQYPASRT